MILIPRWQLADVFQQLDLDECAKLQLDKLGLTELRPFQVSVNEKSLVDAQYAIEELKMLGWIVVDFQLEEQPEFTVLTLVFSPPETPPVRYKLVRELSVKRFSEVEKQLSDDGFQLIKKQEYTLDGQQLIDSLWHKPMPKAIND